MFRWLTVCLILFVSSFSFGEKPKEDSDLVPLPEKVTAPKDNPTTPAKVELGKKLFFDLRLSGDNKMSCATCHMPEKAYGDGLALLCFARKEEKTKQVSADAKELIKRMLTLD